MVDPDAERETVGELHRGRVATVDEIVAVEAKGVAAARFHPFRPVDLAVVVVPAVVAKHFAFALVKIPVGDEAFVGRSFGDGSHHEHENGHRQSGMHIETSACRKICDMLPNDRDVGLDEW